MWFPTPTRRRKRKAKRDDHLTKAERRARRQRRLRRARRAAAGGAAAAVVAGGVIVAAPSDNDFERTVLRLHNELRRGVGCGPLKVNRELDAAAQAKANDMAKHDYMDHNWPNGTKWYENIERHGYRSLPAGENIARGFTDGERVTQAWRNSPGHWKNIRNCSFHQVGIGYNDGYSAVTFGGGR